MRRQCHQGNLTRWQMLVLGLILIGLLWLLPATLTANPELFFEAETLYFDKDYQAAEEKLTAFLETNPEDLAALVLKARISLATGLADQAVAEFEQILELGADPALIAVELAQARNEANRFADNIQQIQPARFPADIAARLYAELGFAYLGNNEALMAGRAFDQALKLEPRSTDALTGQAKLALMREDYPKAISTLTVVTEEDPFHHRSQLLRGLLEHSRQDYVAARTWLEKALATRPADIGSQLALVSLMIDQGELKPAAQRLDDFTRQHPWIPQFHYLQAVIANKLNEPDQAQKALQRAANLLGALPLQAYSQHPDDLLLAAIVYFELGNFARSQLFNEQFLQARGNHYGAKKLRAAILLTRGNFRQAITELQSIVRYNSNDASVYTAIGDAYMGARLYPTAVKSYKEALLVKPDNAAIHQRLAFSQFINGELIEALDHARQAQALGGQNNPLFVALLEHTAGNDDDALDLVNDLVNQQLEQNNKDQLALQFKAAFELASGLYQDAVNSLDPLVAKHPSSRLNLATARRLQNNPELSDQLLVEAAENEDVLFNLALNAEARGELDEAIRYMLKINLWQLPDLKRGLFLMDLYIRQRQLEQADDLQQQINRYFPRNPLLLMRVAQLETLRDEPSGAEAALTSATTNAGYDAAVLYAIAVNQVQLGHYKDAIYTLEKALISLPDNHNLHYLRVRAHVLLGLHDKALQLVDRLIQLHKTSLRARTLRADILYSMGRYAEARELYRALLDLAPTAERAVSLARTMAREERTRDAISFLQQWDRLLPDSVLIKWQLARYLLLENKRAEALAVFNELATLLPEDAMVHNNLANLVLADDPLAALAHAEQALNLLPDHATTVDTYGWVLLNNDRPTEALRYLRDAIARDSSSSVIHYHLAIALQANDKGREAIKHLKLALSGSLSLENLNDAEQRLRQLQESSS